MNARSIVRGLPRYFVKCEVINKSEYGAHSKRNAEDNSSAPTNLFSITLFAKKV